MKNKRSHPPKLKDFLVLKGLFKYSDKEHHLSYKDIRDYLNSHGIQCINTALKSAVDAVRDFGIDVKYKKLSGKYDIWIENHPLSEPQLNKLIIAVSTNPHISDEQTAEILGYLKPFVSVYQEDLLVGNRDTNGENVPKEFFDVFTVISEAIQQKRRVKLTYRYLKYNDKTCEIYERTRRIHSFAPKQICRKDGKLFVVGYNNVDYETIAIDMKYITNASHMQYAFSECQERVERILEDIVPEEHLPGGEDRILYKGEVAFICRWQFLQVLCDRFGPPTKPLKKYIHEIKYTVSDAVITPRTLLWLAEFEKQGIKLRGPKDLISCVREYYEKTGERITDRRIPPIWPTRGRFKR